MELIYIVYSHSDFSDVLEVQNDYFKDIKEEKILLIDKIDESKNYNFDKIFFYDDYLNYTKRIYMCLENFNTDKYILFIHDIDILIEKSDEDIKNLLDIMKQNNIDRLDLKYINYQKFWNNDCYNNLKTNFPEKVIYYNNDIEIMKNESTCYFIYNVNPAIHVYEKFRNIMREFDYSYRDVELKIQQFALENINTYVLYSKKKIGCRHFHLTDIIKYLHITYFGKLVGLECVPWCTGGYLENSIKDHFLNIHEKYTFKNK